MFMPEQVDAFAKAVKADARLKNGFNCIGHSQGGLITRAYIERYNDPPVFNYITWATPHGGQFGIPQLNIPVLRDLFTQLVEGNFSVPLQKTFSFASYWRDPIRYEQYRKVNLFLVDINNEQDTKNPVYKQRLSSLNAFVMFWSTVDVIVVPKQSGTFENYALNSTTVVTPLKQSKLYTEDWLGLKALDTRGALKIISTDCKHENFPDPVCKKWYDNYARAYLNNTLPE